MRAKKLMLGAGSALLVAMVALLSGLPGSGTASAAGIPTAITLSVSAPSGACGATVSAFVTDDIGNPVPDNTVVSFTTDAGTVLAVTSGGTATAVVPGSTVTSGLVTVTAGAVSVQGLVPFTCGSGAFSGGPISVSVACTSTQALVTAFVSDGFGNPVVDGTSISFSASPGAIISQPGFTVGGMATAAWVPGTGVSRSTTVTVTVNNLVSQTFTINCGASGGPAAHMTLFIPQSSVSCGSQAYVFTNATDVFGNQAGGDSVVAFSASTGTIIPATRLSFGSGLSEFTATPGLAAGSVVITANSGGVTAQTSLAITC